MDEIGFEGTHKLMTTENLSLNVFQEESRSEERS